MHLLNYPNQNKQIKNSMMNKFNSLAIYLLFLVTLLKPISTKLGVTILTSKVLLQTNNVNAKNKDYWGKKGNES